jgi:hypothetical protein
MALFSDRSPEDRVEDAAFKAAWKVLEPVTGVLALDQRTQDEAWSRALPAAKAANKGKPRLLDDVVQHQANRGYRRAWTMWNERVGEARATKRRVITETARDASAPVFARLAAGDEVRAALSDAYQAALPQARWLNDGLHTLPDDEYEAAVYDGVQSAADERIAALKAGPPAIGPGPERGPEARRAWDIATDAARHSAAGELVLRTDEDVAAYGEAVAMDAAAAAVQALPDEIVGTLTEEERVQAATQGAAAAAAGTASSRPGTAAAGGFFSSAGTAVGSAAGRTASSARMTGYRMTIAHKVKRAVDAKLPEADGYGLGEPESARAYEAGRLAARAANEDIGTPLAEEDVERLAKMTTAAIIATWHAVGHLKRSGATEAAQGAVRDTALRYLRTTPLPNGLVEYLLDEAIRVATPGWAQPGGDERWADRAAQARRRMQPTTFRGRNVPNYYELLQVSPKADRVVIEKAWRALIATAHPDQGGDPERARQLNEAREVLLDPVTRGQFDDENGF